MAIRRGDSASGEGGGVHAEVQRRTLTVLVIAQIVGTVGVGVAPAIGVLLASEVTDSEVWAGLARSFSTLGAAVIGLPLGALAARRGRRASLAIGWFASGAGGAMLTGAAQWSSVWLLFPGLFLIGIGAAVALQARFAATDLAAPKHRGRALALVVWVGTLGSVVGPNLAVPGRWISDATGLTVYASAFLIAAIALTAAGVVTTIALRPDPLLLSRGGRVAPAARARQGRGGIGRIVQDLPRNRPLRTAVIAMIVGQAVMVSIMTMTPVHIHHHGGSLEIVGITISLHVAGMFALSPIVGRISDRRGPHLAITIGVVIFVASLLISALMPQHTAAVMVALLLLGIGWSFVNVAGSALFNASIQDEGRASAQGGIDAVSNLSGAGAAFLAGPLLAATNFSVLSMVALVVLIPLAVVLAAYRGRPVLG